MQASVINHTQAILFLRYAVTIGHSELRAHRVSVSHIMPVVLERVF